MSDENATPPADTATTPPPAEPPADTRVAELTAEIERLATEAENLKQNWARATADLANYRAQTERDKAEFAKFAAEKTVRAVLPALENLTRAAAHLPENLRADSWATGVLAVAEQLLAALTGVGLTAVNPAAGQPCDASTCEVVAVGPGASGQILEVLQVGYTLGGKVLQTAKVRCGDGSMPAESVQTTGE